MKKCNECNVEMIENCIVKGQHPLKIGLEGTSEMIIFVPKNENKSWNEFRLKARICPKCGKIEFYANLNS